MGTVGAQYGQVSSSSWGTVGARTSKFSEKKFVFEVQFTHLGIRSKDNKILSNFYSNNTKIVSQLYNFSIT